MSRWVKEAEEHKIHETLSQAKIWINTKFEDANSDREIERKRLLKVVNELHRIIVGIDPDLFPVSVVNQVNAHLRHQNFWNQLAAYSKSGSVQNLKTANNHISSQIPVILSLSGVSVRPEERVEVDEIESAYENFCLTLSSEKDVIQKDVKAIKSDISKVVEDIVILQKNMSEIQSELNNIVVGYKNKFLEEEAERKKEFSESEISRKKTYEDMILAAKSNAEDKVKDIALKYNDSLEKVYKDFSSMVVTKSEDISEKHNSILEIHDLVATDGMAGGYKKGADDEKKSADIWRRVSMFCYLVILLWVVFKEKLGFSIFINDIVQWPVLAITISLTGVAFVAAQFASRQSKGHRINEQKMRWFALEIKAIGPFISSLEINQQQELKKQLSERLFGQDRRIDGEKNSPRDVNRIDKLIEAVTELTKRN